MRRILRSRQSLGKYRVEKLLARGGFAEVYRAFDTIEGSRVALKIPYAHLIDQDLLDGFRKEVRLTAQLDHPNILPVKNAAFIDTHFVIVLPLGERSLSDRLKSRMSFGLALDYTGQMLEGLAFAHRRRILHCDVKPDNFIVFSGNRLRLADFGIAKVVLHTVSASGSGTLGYMSPEQAMGKPSFRSDVFSLGLVLYRMFSGQLPQWPFERPYPGAEKLRANFHPEFVSLLKRAIALDSKQRFENADRMLRAFLKVRPRALRHQRRRRRNGVAVSSKPDWKKVRWRQFLREFGVTLEVRGECPKCKGPVSESMRFCCWCGDSIPRYRREPRFSKRCGRCRRGLKSDWRLCPWCFGPSRPDASDRTYRDRRYVARCHNSSCKRKLLMPFMRYCPWCRAKVQRPWPIPGRKENCGHCGWGVLREFWSHCPWCTRRLDRGV